MYSSYQDNPDIMKSYYDSFLGIFEGKQKHAKEAAIANANTLDLSGITNTVNALTATPTAAGISATTYMIMGGIVLAVLAISYFLFFRKS